MKSRKYEKEREKAPYLEDKSFDDNNFSIHVFNLEQQLSRLIHLWLKCRSLSGLELAKSSEYSKVKGINDKIKALEDELKAAKKEYDDFNH